MYYNNDNLSILQAVTKSTFSTPTLATLDPASPPSPVAPTFDLNDPENDNYSYAFVSTGDIDLAAIKKEKAQKLERLNEAEKLANVKGDANSMREEGITTVATTSQRTRYCYYLVLTAMLMACFMLVVMPLLDYDDCMKRLSLAISNIEHATNTTVKHIDLLWHWQDYKGKLGWDQSKAWLHQGKTVLFTRLWTLQPRLAIQAQKCLDDSLGWLDSARQAATTLVVGHFY